jgi:outer membrane protein OmpA-like peptidoglycan-associated protein
MTNASEIETEAETASRSSAAPWLFLLGVIVLIALIGVGLVGYRTLERLDAIEAQVDALSTQALEAAEASERALDGSARAEQAARAAAEGRLLAEAESMRAEETATLARDEARLSRAEADAARAEAERIRKEAEAELNRLEDALGQIADTRRTALGLVMNLGEDALKFDFDKAELKPRNKELLSRIAGILMTSSDYTVSVTGHTDDVGTVEYNLGLSENRAKAVRNYLVEAGISEDILTVEGFGKSQPLVEGTSEEARAKNRRVELGIVNTRIKYPSTRAR